MADAAAVVLFLAVTAYAVFGGADFGGGFWDLIAGGASRGERPRALIDHSPGPMPDCLQFDPAPWVVRGVPGV